LAGLRATPGITNHAFYKMVGIMFIFRTPDVTIRYEGGTIVPRNEQQLQSGHYTFASQGRITWNPEPFILDIQVESTGVERTEEFRKGVRARDKMCVISKDPVEFGCFRGFEACHIYPLSHHRLWINSGHSSWLSPSPIGPDHGINSVKNGILLRRDIHTRFDAFDLTIDPDACLATDSYKIITFMTDNPKIAGTYLPQTVIEHADCPPDDLLRWHFRQAVLKNMR
ncbi:hypothetical protein B9Z19DRAFT_929941, partial [Tuber borchii]